MKTLREMMDLIESAQAGVAEGSEELYQQAIRKYVQRVANDYLGGGNAHLYGAGNFDSEMFGVDTKQAEQDFDKLFPQYVKQLQDKQQGVAEGTESDAYGNTGEKHECGSCDGTGIDTYNDECPECGGKGWVRDKEEQLEETTPDAMAKIDDLFRK